MKGKKRTKLFRLFQRKAVKIWGIELAAVIVFAYATLLNAIPDNIYVHETTKDFHLPLPVVFTEVKKETKAAAGNISSYRDGDIRDVDVTQQNLTYHGKLFGLIPVKEVTAQVKEPVFVVPGGTPVGIYVKTDGVLVIGTGKITGKSGEVESPAENLVKSGDYIQQVNGETIETKEQLIDIIGNCGGRKVILKILREGSLIEVAVHPVESDQGTYKIGLWVRDDLAGIGTLTYVTENQEYGALGHGVSDADTGVMLNLKDGVLYESSIIGIVKGESGTPGELTGVINYTREGRLGDIEKNTQAGIYGIMEEMPEGRKAEYPIGFKQEIRQGEAEIITSVDNQTDTYAINITEVDYHEDEEYKEIMFEVTDERLLEKTGGIVQGMSGSPIIQNGKIVGAVTHVFIQNSKKGYGIFIEDMLKNNS